MATVVGTKGQVVIEKGIRDKLGIRPGWHAAQVIVDGHVELHFLPPSHRRSLQGSLTKFVRKTLPQGKAWARARQRASDNHVREKYGKRSEG